MTWRTSLFSGANPLERYFDKNDQRLIHKWLHYFDIYHRHFARFRHRKIVVLEFGVSQGGSLQMWQKYFGRRARIHGVDIDPRCKQFEDSQTKIFIGDQEDREFLLSIAKQIGPVDVLIEDGGHTMAQQIATFEVFYPLMSTNGVYLCEDVHTSYKPAYGGGFRVPGTFMEYAKDLTDKLYAWDLPKQQPVDKFTRTTKSVHFYNGVVVFERGEVTRPKHKTSGTKVFKRGRARPATTPTVSRPTDAGDSTDSTGGAAS